MFLVLFIETLLFLPYSRMVACRDHAVEQYIIVTVCDWRYFTGNRRNGGINLTE